jgi:uncharacterized protein
VTSKASPGHAWWPGLIALLLAFLAHAQQPVPTLAARVTDLTGTLASAERQALEAKLAEFEAGKGSQIAVLIVATTRPEAIEQYGIRVAEAWKLGRQGIDDGALLLVAKDDRALRIEVGYGLEGAIPDALAKRVIAEVIAPRFRAGDFAGGLNAGVDALIGLVSGEPLPEPRARPSGQAGIDFLENTLPVAMLFIFVVGGLLRSLLGRLPGASVAGAVSFVGAWMLLGGFVAALVIAVIVFIITLAGGGRPAVGYRGGGFGTGGGFGGGGFSGGGGGFGGGGASGRW